MEPQDARSAFTRSRVFRGPHDENPYIPIRGWNHPFLDSMQFPRGHVRPPVFRGFLSSAVYRRRAEGPDEKAWARIRAMQCVLGRGVCFCRPSSRRTARFLQQISSYKRLLPLAVEDALRGPRKMPDQRIADEADFGGLLKMASLCCRRRGRLHHNHVSALAMQLAKAFGSSTLRPRARVCSYIRQRCGTKRPSSPGNV